MTYRNTCRLTIQRGGAAAAVAILVFLAGSCATMQQPGEEMGAEPEPFSEVSTVVIAPFEYRSTVTEARGDDPAEPLDPAVAQAMRAELAATLEESGRQVIVLSEQETTALVPGEVEELAARLGADAVIRGDVRLGASRVDYVVSVSSTVAAAGTGAEAMTVTVSAQERYGRDVLDVEAVTRGVGAVVIGQVMGLLAAR